MKTKLLPGLSDNRKKQRSGTHNPQKPYWYWICGCGYSDNRNTNSNCQMCGERITCRAAGGSFFHAGSDVCIRGCCMKDGVF